MVRPRHGGHLLETWDSGVVIQEWGFRLRRWLRQGMRRAEAFTPTCCGGRVSPHARERLYTLHPHIMHDGIGPPRDRGTSDEDEEARGCLPLDEDEDSMSPMRRSQ